MLVNVIVDALVRILVVVVIHLRVVRLHLERWVYQ